MLEPATRLDQLCDAQPFHTGWSLADLGTGWTADRNGDVSVPSASTRKVAILLAALAAVHEGALDLEQSVRIDERFRDQVFTGTLQHLSAGLTLSLRDVLTLMIIWSDNLCTAHVLDVLGLDAVNAWCARVGMTRTRHRHALIPPLSRDHRVEETNSTTPNDQVHMLRLVVAGADDLAVAAGLGVDPGLCRLALDVLCRQQHRDGRTALLPADVVVAHKSGRGWRDVSEVGVVFAAGAPRYALAVYVDQVPHSVGGLSGIVAARRHLAELSQACWELLVPVGGRHPVEG